MKDMKNVHNEMEVSSGNKPAPLMRAFCASPLTGEQIEAESFRIIDREAPAHRFTGEEWEVVRRLIHTTADFTLMEAVRFSLDALSAALAALRAGRPFFVDSNMIRAGLSIARLRAVCPNYGLDSIVCHIGDADVAEEARQAGYPRSLTAIRKAKQMLNGAVAVFGNAPIALMELNRLIQEEGLRPALVIAMPVGFVHVVESKDELISLKVPFIALAGRRGGSPLAVSVVHALCSLALAQPQEGSWVVGMQPVSVVASTATKIAASKKPEEVPGTAKEAIILLGHGSRVPEAGRDMEQVARRLQERYISPLVEVCSMSRLGPHFPEVFEKCVQQGVTSVVVIPYFLHSGLHMRLDIPEMLQEEVRKFPHVKVCLGRGFGFDELLVDLVQRRIEEAREVCDVRNLMLPSKEEFPVPPGQCEFVPMPPSEAAKFRS
jgi:precorrin-8X/cobalt-precorrin-8 methylmutase